MGTRLSLVLVLSLGYLLSFDAGAAQSSVVHPFDMRMGPQSWL